MLSVMVTDKMRVESGEKTTAGDCGPRMAGKIWAPVVTFQTRTLRSHEPETTLLPSGENATEEMCPSCPRNSEILAPVITSKTMMLPLFEPETIIFPLGEKAAH